MTIPRTISATLRCGAGLALLAAVGRAQIDEAELRTKLLTTFRAVENPAEHGFADLEAVYRALEDLRTRCEALASPRREQTRFFLGVRMADARLRQERLGEAAVLLRSARETAIRDGVWSGSYRAQAIVLLEQCVGHGEFLPILLAEADFLAGEEPMVAAPWLALPLEYLRAELIAARGDDPAALTARIAVADRALREHGQDDPWRIKCVGRLAWEFLVRRDFARAEQYLKELPPRIAAYPRGLIALRRGDAEFALRAGRAVAREGQKVRGAMLEAEALEQLGRHAEAETIWARLVDEAREPLDRAIAKRSLGECALLSTPPDFARAKDHLIAALALLSDDRHAVAERVQVHALLGEAMSGLGDFASAKSAFVRSLDELDAARDGLALDLFGATWHAREQLRAIGGLLAIWSNTDSAAVDALAIMELGKARTLLDWAVHPPTVGEETALRDGLRAVAASADPATLDLSMRELEAARRGSGAGGVARARTLDATSLRGMVGAEHRRVFLSYWVGAREAFVLAACGDEAQLVSLGSAAALESDLAAAIAAMRDGRDCEAALAELSSRVIPDAIARRLQQSAELVICPDDVTARLPFEALPLHGRPLGVSHAVERAPSLSLRAVLQKRVASGTRGMVVDSVPTGGVGPTITLEPLEFSAREAEWIERVRRDGVLRIQRSDATFAALDAALAREAFEFVHLSTHAIENAALPTASALWLADGLVTVPSLAKLRLQGALLLLSACSSAHASVASGGEGGLGLLGWPMAAGARGAVASLWPVNQQATADLMAQFHSFAAEGHSAAEAMRRAREVLASSPQYAHPRYWAGFGVFAPLPSDGTEFMRWWMWATLGLLAAGGGFALLRARRA
ncbi:MAG: CHAT domain-containing protein [Planctomycetota bacterium]